MRHVAALLDKIINGRLGGRVNGGTGRVRCPESGLLRAHFPVHGPPPVTSGDVDLLVVMAMEGNSVLAAGEDVS